MDALGWKYYLVYVGWLVVEILVFWFLYPETKGYTLERLQLVFGEDVKLSGLEEKGLQQDADVEHKVAADNGVHVERSN